MDNLIIIGVLLVIVGGAIWYIRKEKKKGTKCIGCPDGCSCGAQSGCGTCGGCNRVFQ